MLAKWIGGKTKKHIAADDKRDAMTRLLSQTNKGLVYVEYAQQWKTHRQARLYGYIDENGYITERGKEILARELAKLQ